MEFNKTQTRKLLSFNEIMGKESPDFNQGRNCLSCCNTGFEYISPLLLYSYCLMYSYNSCVTINDHPKTVQLLFLDVFERKYEHWSL